MATWALTTWPPIGLAQPLLAACCTPRAQAIEWHRNAQQQLLALEQTLGALVPQAAYCGILELFWTFPAYQAPLVRWLLSNPENLTKRILTSLKILHNLQRTLIVTLGIRGPGGAPGVPSQAILPQFVESVGGGEQLDWFAVDSKHACDVLGFLTPHLHVAQDEPESLSLPLHTFTQDGEWTMAAASPSFATMQPPTPDRVAEGAAGPDPMSHRLSLTPSGLAVIPEDEKAGLQSFEEDEASAGGSEQLDDYVERYDSGDDAQAPPSPRHIFSVSDVGVSSENTSHSVSGERSYPGLHEEVSQTSYAHRDDLDLERVDTGDSAPPELAEEEGKLAFEDSEHTLSGNMDGQYVEAERSRSSGSAVSRGTEPRHSANLWWDYAPESPSGELELEAAELWDCHRSKLEELEDALERIRM